MTKRLSFPDRERAREAISFAISDPPPVGSIRPPRERLGAQTTGAATHSGGLRYPFAAILAVAVFAAGVLASTVYREIRRDTVRSDALVAAQRSDLRADQLELKVERLETEALAREGELGELREYKKHAEVMRAENRAIDEQLLEDLRLYAMNRDWGDAIQTFYYLSETVVRGQNTDMAFVTALVESIRKTIADARIAMENTDVRDSINAGKVDSP